MPENQVLRKEKAHCGRIGLVVTGLVPLHNTSTHKGCRHACRSSQACKRTLTRVLLSQMYRGLLRACSVRSLEYFHQNLHAPVTFSTCSLNVLVHYWLPLLFIYLPAPVSAQTHTTKGKLIS